MIDWNAARGWTQRHRVRTWLYVLLPLLVLATVLATFVAGSGGRGLLFQVADSAAGHHLAEDLGAAYRIDSIRICWRPHLGVQVSGITFHLLHEPVTGHIDGASLFLNGGSSVEGVRLGTDAAHDAIRLARLDGDLVHLRVAFAGIAVPLSEAADSYFSTQNVVVDGLALHRAPPSIAVSRLAVDGTEVLVQRDAAGTLDLTALPTLQALGASLGRAQEATVGNLNHVVRRLRRWLAVTLAGALLFFVFLKFCAERAAQATRGWTVVAVAVVLVPLACYGLLLARVSLRTFVSLALLLSILVAVAMWLRLYRMASEWHQRWEPFGVDIVSAALVIPLLSAYGMLGVRLVPPKSLGIGHTEIRNSHVAVRDSGTGTNLGDLSISHFLDEGFALNLAPLRPTINFGRASLNGMITAGLPELQKLEWLPAAWSRPTTVEFCGAVRDRATRAGPSQPDRCPANSSNHPTVTTDVAAGILLAPLELSYSGKTQAQVDSTLLTFDAEGDQNSILVRNIASIGNPQLQFGAASANLNFRPRLSGALSLEELHARAGAVRLSAPFVDADFSTSGVSSSANLQGHISVRGMSVQRNGYDAAVDRANFQLKKSAIGGNITALADLHQVILNGHHPSEAYPWLHAEFPYVALETKGTLADAVIPRSFNGATSLTVARSAHPSHGYQDTAFWTDAPLHFGVDVWKGLLQVTNQMVTFHQSTVPQAPGSMTANIGGTGQLVALESPISGWAEAQMLIPHLSSDLPSGRLELNGLNVSLRMSEKSGVSSISSQYASDWSTVAIKGMTGRLPGLKEVTEFTLESHGFLPQLPNSKQARHPLEQPGPGVASLPKQITFRLQGRWPASRGAPLVEILSSAGIGVRVADIKSLITKLDVPDSRLETLKTQLHAFGIQTADGKGNLTLSSQTEISRRGTMALISTPLTRGGQLALRIENTPQTLGIELADLLPVGHLISELEPFIQQAGFRLAGFTSDAEIKTFTAIAKFSDEREVTGLDAELEIPPSMLASLDLPKLLPGRPLPFEKIDVLLPYDPAGRIRLTVHPSVDRDHERNLTDVAVGLDHLVFVGVDSAARKYQAEVSLSTKATLWIGDKNNSAANPVWEKVIASGSALSGHAGNALRFFGSEFDSQPEISNVTWTLELGNRTGNPVLSVAPDKLSLDLSGAVKDIDWQRGNEKNRSELHSSFEVATDFRMHNGELVADGYAPLQIGLSLKDQPPRTVSLRLPFLAILADRLHRADRTSGWLWDPGYYDSFWKKYQPSRANLGPISIIDTPDLVLSSLSIQQLRIPSEPLRMAVGQSESLQLDMPVTSQVLFGSSQGRVQADVRWPTAPSSGPANAAILDTRVTIDFSKVQAGAIRRAVADGGLPLVEDEIDGNVDFRTADFALSAAALRRLASGVVRQEDLEHLSAIAKFSSARSDHSGKARVQAIAEVQVKDLNSILSAITRDLKVHFPPRSMTYDSMSLNFETSNGMVRTHPSLFELSGIEFYSTRQVELGGNIRLNAGRGETVSLESLLNLGKTFISTEVTDGARNAR